MSTGTTPEATITVGEGRREDLPELAIMLAGSFQDCPAWDWYLPPDSKGRLQRMERFFSFLLDRFYLDSDGHECITTEHRTGAALWDRPNEWEMGTGDNVHMLAAMLPIFRRRFPRTVRGLSALESKHPREPHYYLSVLGVSPDVRGADLAEALIRPGLERCDRERVPAYLETGRRKSLGFYGRDGFEVIEEFDLPGGGPPVWRMWREPMSGNGETGKVA
jgi:GNAT superfamily N-acetyltransferase